MHHYYYKILPASQHSKDLYYLYINFTILKDFDLVNIRYSQGKSPPRWLDYIEL